MGCAIDRATVVQVLQHVPDAGAALAELQWVLRPGGRILALDTDPQLPTRMAAAPPTPASPTWPSRSSPP